MGQLHWIISRTRAFTNNHYSIDKHGYVCNNDVTAFYIEWYLSLLNLFDKSFT